MSRSYPLGCREARKVGERGSEAFSGPSASASCRSNGVSNPAPRPGSRSTGTRLPDRSLRAAGTYGARERYASELALRNPASASARRRLRGFVRGSRRCRDEPLVLLWNGSLMFTVACYPIAAGDIAPGVEMLSEKCLACWLPPVFADIVPVVSGLTLVAVTTLTVSPSAVGPG